MSIKTPDFLFDSYKSYKRDTQDVARWLSESARKCPPAPSSKTAETSSTDNSKTTDNPSSKESLPGLWEFVPLAKSVSESIEVPKSIVSSLKSLIRKRKTCNTWFSDQVGDESHISKNYSHDHAISTFQQVLQILEPRVPKPRIEPNLGSQKDDQVPANAFQALNVEDAFSDDENDYAPSTQQQNPPTPHDHESGPCQGCIQADLAFQCYCFYGDLDIYRQYLRLIWRYHRDGELDLMTVSVITDTALDILERAENEFCPDFSVLSESEGVAAMQALPKYEMTAGYLFLRYCQCEGQDPTYRERPEDDFNLAMYDTATWLCMPTQNAIMQLFDQLRPTSLAEYDFFPFGKVEGKVPWESGPGVPWEELAPREQIEVDRNILKEFIFSMETFRLAHKSYAYDNGMKRIPIKDRLSKGFLGALENRTRPRLWLVFAAQIYLDIRHIMDKDSERSLEVLRSTAAESVATVKEIMAEAIAGTTNPDWDFIKNKDFIDLTNGIVWWLGDDHVKWIFERFGGPKVLPPYHLFSIHPFLCGVMAFNIILTMQTLGLQYSSAWKATTAVAHLYNAGRQSGLITIEWPDMETFIAIHPKIFPTGRPKNPKDFHIDAIKALEWVYIPDHHLSKTKRRYAQKLGVKETCPLSSIFINRYSWKPDAEDHFQITLHDVETLLDKSASREDLELSSLQPNAKRVKAGKAARNKHHRLTASRAALVKQVEETRRLGPFELLETLRLALGAELIPALTFNYLRMHIRCMNLLRDLRGRLGSFVTIEHPNLAGSEMPSHLLPHLVLFVLGKHSISGHTNSPDPLKRACDVLNSYIEREGRVENDRMAELEDEWFGGADRDGKGFEKRDVMSEAKKLLEVIVIGKQEALNLLAHFKEVHQDFVPFEAYYKDLYDAKKEEENKDAAAEGEKPKKKRKRSKKKKNPAMNDGQEGVKDGGGELQQGDSGESEDSGSES